MSDQTGAGGSFISGGRNGNLLLNGANATGDDSSNGARTTKILYKCVFLSYAFLF